MGTLDPLADGVLPIGVGNATRLFDFFLQKEKEYIAEFTFGVRSDTLDSTGEMIVDGRVPTEEEIASVLPRFLGDIMQMPPKYSAKNVNGKRGYDLARAGVEFELNAQQVHIYGIETLGKAESADTYRLKIRCGGGTYIRSLARDIAGALGTNAVMSALSRTQSGYFTIEESIPFSLLESDPSVAELQKYMIPTERVIPYETITLTPKAYVRVFQGVPTTVDYPDGLYKIYQEEKFYGIAQVADGKVKIKTKLC
jgi:tRNA pseudouridine55 synthase